MSPVTDGLTNWGRWGANDEIGCLHLMTPDVIKRAAGLVRTGKAYSLGMPLDSRGPQWPLRHKTWKVTTFRSHAEGRGSCDDVVTLHSHSSTHMDALCHVWYEDTLYNGASATEHIVSSGATRNSIDKVPFIVGRGVLLDVAASKGVEHLEVGEPITATDLDRCASEQGVEIGASDIVIVRTGWLRVFREDPKLFNSGEPGLDMSTLQWLRGHDVMAIGADNHGVEVMESIPPDDIPFHRVAIRDLGLYLLENLNLEVLAEDGVKEFLLVITPLRLTAGVGSPINPVAIT